MDAGERALLTATVRDALAAADDAGADRVLDELGWRDMLAAEPDAAIAIVFEQLGRANASASVLDDVVIYALGVTPGRELAVLHPPVGAWVIRESAGHADGLGTVRLSTARELLAGHERVGVDRVTAQPVAGIDPDARLQRLRVAIDGPGKADTAREHAVALARRALAHQIAGATRTMLEQARQHALERVQFGRPIASFQAVRHRLAEALVAVEALDAVLLAAADEPGYETAALAKAVAGRTARTVATHVQQVLAGIGFTTDHPFHRYLKRTILLDGLYGSVDGVTVELGHRLLAERRVPALIEL